MCTMGSTLLTLYGLQLMHVMQPARATLEAGVEARHTHGWHRIGHFAYWYWLIGGS